MFKSLLILGFVLFLNIFNITQISERQFFKEYLLNTTQVDIYNNDKAYIYLDNKTSSQYFIQLENKTGFTYKLMEENIEVLPKISMQKFMQTVMFILFFAVLLTHKLGIGSLTNFIEMNVDENVKIKLKDVAGLDDIKIEVFEFVDFLKNRDKYLEIGARIPRGALFHGPPGTGKTLLAKAVAGECKISFISVAGSDFSELYVGVGAARIRSLFAKARAKAPCIVFIDEIDALGGMRAHNSHHDKDNTLNRFLIELDGFTQNENILIFAATNRIDILDKALLRPGRFDRKIQFFLPEKDDRKKIFEYYISQMHTTGVIDVDMLAKQCFGFSGADISHVCNEACILSIRENKIAVTSDILDNAVANVLLGPEKNSFRLSTKEKTIIAYHEAGHACMSYLLPDAAKSIKISILPRGKSALGFSQIEVSEEKLKSNNELLAHICVLFGGRVAEEIFCETITTGASDDIEKLTKLAYEYVYTYGMTNQYIHPETSDQFKYKIDQSIDNIIHQSYQKVKKLLLVNKEYVEKLKCDLLEKETLTALDLENIFKIDLKKY